MTQTLTKIKIRHAEYYGLQETFDDLYARSGNGETFGHLMETIESRENIMLAYRNIKANRGSRTAGTDGKDIGHLAAMSEEEFVRTVQRKFANYQPKAVRRAEIPKPNGKTRPLGIPCIIDRIVQQCILQVLEPICEARFHPHSHGFRPNRSAENAVADCYRMMQRCNLHYVVDVDIEGFFDNVNHRKLMQQLWTMGIRDTRLLKMVKAMLKAPIQMPNGETVKPEKGTPQGGILSPLLANVVLNELDWWIASQWELQYEHARHTYYVDRDEEGAVNRNGSYRALRQTRLKEMYIVRYADDFKVFCRSRRDAERTFEAVRQWLCQRLKLNVSPEKSKVTNLRKSYCEFLGFKIKVRQKGKTKSGEPDWVVVSHVADKAVQRIEETLRDMLDQIQKPRDGRSRSLRVDLYNAKVVGIQNYYSMATMVSTDLNRVNWIMQNRINQHLATDRKGDWHSEFLKERFGGSKMVRWVGDRPIVPVGYVRSRKPMCKRRGVCSYTPQGRDAIHANLQVDAASIAYLMSHPIPNRSVEYNDNRISRFAAQHGRCYVTGWELLPAEAHCHHRQPLARGGTDSYQNLVILHEDAHVLVHAVKEETIGRYIATLGLGAKEIEKVNKLRVAAGLEPIEATECL